MCSEQHLTRIGFEIIETNLISLRYLIARFSSLDNVAFSMELRMIISLLSFFRCTEHGWSVHCEHDTRTGGVDYKQQSIAECSRCHSDAHKKCSGTKCHKNHRADDQANRCRGDARRSSATYQHTSTVKWDFDKHLRRAVRNSRREKEEKEAEDKAQGSTSHRTADRADSIHREP